MRHWIRCDIDQRVPILTEAKAEVNIGILWSISHHIQCLISQQLFYYITFRERCTGIIAPEKILNLYTSFGKSKAYSRISADLD